MKCPLKGKRKETSQMPQKAQHTSVDQRFSNIRNKCIHCGGDHASGTCPTRMQPQTTPSTAGYMVYNGSTGAGKTNNNTSLPFSTKNGESAAGSATPSSLVNNSTGTQGHASCTQAPQITPEVSPNTSQKILTTYHQCNYQINFHHLLISQFHFHPHLLHPLTCQMHIQLLYQIFQQRLPL